MQPGISNSGTGNSGAARDPWLVRSPRASSASWRLFCFPYAGGASNIYRGWGELLDRSVAGGLEVVAVELPGRASRFREAPYRTIAEAVAGAGSAIAPLLDRPFAFFGHSLGAVLAFELARWLRREGRPQPRQLFVSARRAPHLPDDEEPISGLSDEEFVARLRELNGTP
jgi:medium-chain acyl-[acyl-carrier-protein] hydrolase